jgi:hypothetical protein
LDVFADVADAMEHLATVQGGAHAAVTEFSVVLVA